MPENVSTDDQSGIGDLWLNTNSSHFLLVKQNGHYMQMAFSLTTTTKGS